MDPVATEQSTSEVSVSFMGELPALIGDRNLRIRLPRNATVGAVLECLSEKYGETFRCRIFVEPGSLRHTVLIFVDGEHIKEIGGLGARLGEGEVEVILLPMFGGG
ncbi:MAG: MoaD/ThiS family protein [Burkholderiales bacterium]|nr:MoaD/ThiS family protein [Burkholderiales bacterium]